MAYILESGKPNLMLITFIGRFDYLTIGTKNLQEEVGEDRQGLDFQSGWVVSLVAKQVEQQWLGWEEDDAAGRDGRREELMC